MAFKSAKHRSVASVNLAFDGGLNLFDSPTAISDNQLTMAVNVLYGAGEAILSTRTGLNCVASPITGLGITKLHYYVKDSTHSWIIASMTNGNLYYLDEDTNSWVYIADMSSSAITPSILTFNGRLMVADGSSCLHYWHGRYATTSATSHAIGTGAMTFVLAADIAWQTGEPVTIRHDSINYLVGEVTTYTPATKTLVVDVTESSGAGTYTAWTVDGYIPITGSPQATALAQIGNRLVCNSAQDLDGVYLSNVEDEEEWNTGNGALFFRAGYRDALVVNGFAVFGSDLIIFKGGAAGKAIYRLNIASSSASDWYVIPLSQNLTATSAHAIEFVGNNVLFGSDQGIMDISGVQQYGDLQVSSVGKYVNPHLNGKQIAELRYLPSKGIMLAFVAGDYRILAYHAHNSAWTMLDFQQMFLSTACDAGGTIYLAGQNGYLYRLSTLEDQDETAPSVYADYSGVIRTKLFSFDGEVIIRKSRLYYEALTDGEGEFGFVGRDGIDVTPLLTWTPQAGASLLYDATGYLDAATMKLGAQSVDYKVSRARARDQAISFQIKTTSGRVKLRQATVELASVNG